MSRKCSSPNSINSRKGKLTLGIKVRRVLSINSTWKSALFTNLSGSFLSGRRSPPCSPSLHRDHGGLLSASSGCDWRTELGELNSSFYLDKFKCNDLCDWWLPCCPARLWECKPQDGSLQAPPLPRAPPPRMPGAGLPAAPPLPPTMLLLRPKACPLQKTKQLHHFLGKRLHMKL